MGRGREEMTEEMIDMIGELAGMSRRAKLFRGTLEKACEGRPLGRKSIQNLRRFFDDITEDLGSLRKMITCVVLNDILGPDPDEFRGRITGVRAPGNIQRI
jgi:hypothetical protein